MSEHYTPTNQREASGCILTAVGVVVGFLFVAVIVASDPAQIFDPAAQRAAWLPQSNLFWVVAPLVAIALAARLARYWLGCSFVAGFLSGGYLACIIMAVWLVVLEII